MSIFNAENPYTFERIEYENLGEVPRYEILNLNTGEIRLYKKLSDVPKDEQKYFTKRLGIICKLRRTCNEE